MRHDAMLLCLYDRYISQNSERQKYFLLRLIFLKHLYIIQLKKYLVYLRNCKEK